MGHLSDAHLNEYLDGELEASHRPRFEAHLETCDACQARLALLESVFDDLARVTETPPNRDLAEPVIHAIRARQRESRLVARLAGVEVLLGALVAVAGLMLSGGIGLVAEAQLAILEWSQRVYIDAELAGQDAFEALTDVYQALAALLTDAAQVPSSSVPGWVSWGPFLGLALALWLLGNGLLLREHGHRGSH